MKHLSITIYDSNEGLTNMEEMNKLMKFISKQTDIRISQPYVTRYENIAAGLISYRVATDSISFNAFYNSNKTYIDLFSVKEFNNNKIIEYLSKLFNSENIHCGEIHTKKKLIK